MELVVRFKQDTWENALETGKVKVIIAVVIILPVLEPPLIV